MTLSRRPATRVANPARLNSGTEGVFDLGRKTLNSAKLRCPRLGDLGQRVFFACAGLLRAARAVCAENGVLQ